jgi:hypothetical protein
MALCERVLSSSWRKQKKKYKISMTFSLQKGEQEDQKSFTGKEILWLTKVSNTSLTSMLGAKSTHNVPVSKQFLSWKWSIQCWWHDRGSINHKGYFPPHQKACAFELSSKIQPANQEHSVCTRTMNPLIQACQRYIVLVLQDFRV